MSVIYAERQPLLNRVASTNIKKMPFSPLTVHSVRGNMAIQSKRRGTFNSAWRSLPFNLICSSALVASSWPALAGVSDPSAGFIEQQTAPGETTNRVCLPDGFVIVEFLDSSNNLVSSVPSSTTCDPNAQITPNPVNNSATNANQAKATADAALQSVLPGSVTGDIFGDLNIPNFRDPFTTQLIRATPRRSNTDIERDPNYLNQEFGRGVTVAEILDFLNAKQELSNLGQDLEAARLAIVGASDAVDFAQSNLQSAINAEAAGEQATRFDLGTEQSPNTTTEEMRQVLEDAQSRLAEERAGFADLVIRRDELMSGIEDAERSATPEGATDFERFVASTPDKALLDKGIDVDTVDGRRAAFEELARMRDELETNRIDRLNGPSGQPSYFFPSLPDLNRLHARFDLAADRRAVAAANSLAARPDGLLGDNRFSLWFGSDITLHRDRRSIGQEGESLSADGGVSYLVADDLNLGLSARYSHTDTDGGTGETIADTYTLSVFAQKQVFNEAIVEAIIAYSLVDLDLTFKNAGVVSGFGTTDATSLAAQTRISQRFELDGNWWLAPNLGASVVTTDRHAFTTSDGTDVGATRSTQVVLVGGPSVGTSWVVKGGGINWTDLTVAPSFGLLANYNLGRFDRVVDANNNVFETDRFGLAASAGLGLGFERGGTLSFNANYAGIASDRRNIAFGARVNIPFN